GRSANRGASSRASLLRRTSVRGSRFKSLGAARPLSCYASPAMPVVSATDANVEAAARVVRAGGIVAFPTETVYGLGANALSSSACAAIFEAKRRPAFDPLIVHVNDASGARSLVTRFDARAEKLASAFWPGPLTLVLPKKPDGVCDLA